jgi:acyl-CoA thioesterase
MDSVREFFRRDRFARRSAIELVDVSAGYAKARMTLDPDWHHNGIGIVHGGAIFTLADFAFAAASNSHGTVAVAVNCQITIMKAAATGVLVAECREQAKNPKLGTYTAEVRDADGALIALFQGLAYRKADPLPV